MIRTPTEWLNSDAYKALAAGGTLAAFIEAVQRDAVEACAIASYWHMIEKAAGMTDATLGDALRALIPPKPKTWREGGGDGPQQWVEQYAGPCGSTSCPATGPHEHHGGVASAIIPPKPKETP